MRLRMVLALIPFLIAISFAQETNFSLGPQYLVTNGSPQTLRPIATPSLSLGEAQPSVANVTPTETLAEQSPSISSGPSDTFLGGVYWGDHKSSEIIGHRLETPSMTVSETALYMESVANQVAGVPSAETTETAQPAETSIRSSVIELTGLPFPTNLTASILDVGVTGMTDVRALAARGYGISLGELAAYWKTHKRTAPRVFTNSDVARPRG